MQKYKSTCGSLNENCPLCSKGSPAVLEELCLWLWALRLQKLNLRLVCLVLFLLPADPDVELSTSTP